MGHKRNEYEKKKKFKNYKNKDKHNDKNEDILLQMWEEQRRNKG